MPNTFKMMLDDLGLNEKWVTVNVVDKAFVEEWYARFPDKDAEHIRIKFYAKFFSRPSRDRAE